MITMINDLGFNEEYINPIKEGIKTSTICRHFNAKIGDKIQAEEMQPKPDIEKLKSLRKVERSCLKQLMK